MLEQSYTSQPAGSPGGGIAASRGAKDDTQYWDLPKLRKAYTDYLFAKREEIDEQIDARRYYHGSQWTKDQIRVLQKRKQPIMTFNRVGRKIDGTVGTIEKLRMDPKAYARTPQHEQGADLATAAVRYVLDENEWKNVSPQCAHDGAVEGIGGIELEITTGDQGDPDIGMRDVDVSSFFYDPRSYRDDFSDAEYMGIGKWLLNSKVKSMFKDAPDLAFSADAELVSNSDREMKWFSQGTGKNRTRMVELWYQHQDGWCWAIFSGTYIFAEGKSWLNDEKGKPRCKYEMFSGFVDQDGDRYGFVRNMKSAQDGLNAKQSKMQHMLASKRIFLTRGAVTDIETVRREAARPDGVVVVDRPINEGLKVDDQSFDFAGLTKMLELNIAEIENFGPNHALVGEGGVEKNSGRAIALLQQAGMAELGPYMIAYKGWKLRVYRAIWNAVQQHWQGQRWIRVTDDQNLAQFIQVNGLGIGQDGQPTLVNALGALDVDIIMDEGPDTVNQMADTHETLREVIPAIAQLIPPQKAELLVDTLVLTSPLPSDAKQKYKQVTAQLQNQPPQPPPEVQAVMAKAQVDMQAKQADMQLDAAKAQQDMQHKEREQQFNMAAKMQENEQEHAHTERLHQLEVAKEHAKSQIQLHHESKKQEQNLAHEKAKAEITTTAKKDEADIKKRTMLAVADPEAANELDNLDAFKEMMKNFQRGLDEVAKSVEVGIEKVAAQVAKDKDDGPKHFTLERDKSGRLKGVTVN